MKDISKFPYGPIKEVTGKGIALYGDDIDTDRIIPARFLKCVSFEALGNQVFADDRAELKGYHPFDIKQNQGSSILIVNENFGCGSSREHAPQALMRWGIRGIIGESFAEIFHGNCLAIGIICATSTKNDIQLLQSKVEEDSLLLWEINVKTSQLKSSAGQWNLIFEKGFQEILLSGQWDATSQLIKNQSRLEATMARLPYLNNFKMN